MEILDLNTVGIYVFWHFTLKTMLEILMKLVLIMLVLSTLKNNIMNFGKTLFKPLGHK
jgi:hypothetical protein